MEFDPNKKDNSEYFLSDEFLNSIQEKIDTISKTIGVINDVKMMLVDTSILKGEDTL